MEKISSGKGLGKVKNSILDMSCQFAIHITVLSRLLGRALECPSHQPWDWMRPLRERESRRHRSVHFVDSEGVDVCWYFLCEAHQLRVGGMYWSFKD